MPHYRLPPITSLLLLNPLALCRLYSLYRYRFPITVVINITELQTRASKCSAWAALNILNAEETAFGSQYPY